MTQDLKSIVAEILNTLPTAHIPMSTIGQLSQLPRKTTLEYLKEIAATGREEVSDRAVRAILQIDSEFGKRVLLELVQNSNWHWYFAYSALKYGDKTFILPLCSILRESTDPNARYMAAIALERIGDSTALSSLTLALNDDGEDYEGRSISEQTHKTIIAISSRVQ